MVNITHSFQANPIITSLREFTRNPKLRKKALKEKKAVIIENKREQSFFVLFPPTLYDRLYDMYLDMRDSELLSKAMKKKTTWHEWDKIEKELLE